MAAYILSVDQSTQGTKALIFDQKGAILARADVPHRQIIDSAGWVEHDLEEILQNTIEASRQAAAKAGIDPADIACMGISNQREPGNRSPGSQRHRLAVRPGKGHLRRAGAGRLGPGGKRAHRDQSLPLLLRLQAGVASAECAGGAGAVPDRKALLRDH